MNYFCKLVNSNLPEIHFANVMVAAGTTLRAGNIIVAETLDAAIRGNYSVYSAGEVTDITNQEVCIVLNGEIETLADGRRPDGQPNYGKYEFKAGDVAPCVRLNTSNIKLEISKDALATDSAAVVVGGKLVPVNAEDTLTFEAATTDTTALNYLKVEAKKYFRIGGISGAEFAETYVVRSAIGNAASITPSV